MDAATTYELNHLATFGIKAKQGVVKASDGLERLKQLEATSGVWTMKVTVRIDWRSVCVMDTATHKVHSCCIYIMVVVDDDDY